MHTRAANRKLNEIGRIADGGLPLLFPPEHYQNVIPHIRKGAQDAGRDLAHIDVAACIWCSVSDDKAAAEDVLKEKIAYYGHAFSETILSQLGLTRTDFEPIEQAIMTENNLAKAKSLITPQMLKFGIAGTSTELIKRIEKLTVLGVQHISFGPPIGPDIDAAIYAIGWDVIPYFSNVAPVSNTS